MGGVGFEGKDHTFRLCIFSLRCKGKGGEVAGYRRQELERWVFGLDIAYSSACMLLYFIASTL